MIIAQQVIGKMTTVYELIFTFDSENAKDKNWEVPPTASDLKVWIQNQKRVKTSF